MTREELFDVLRPIVIQRTGIAECILADPNAPAPSGEYAVIEPFDSISEVGTGGETQRQVDAVDGNPNFKDLEITVRSSQEVRASVNFYRGNARDYAPMLKQADKFPSVNERLFLAGLGWMRTSEINNLTTLTSGQQEPRAQLYIYLRRMERATETVQQIYAMPFEIQDEHGNVISTGEVDTN